MDGSLRQVMQPQENPYRGSLKDLGGIESLYVMPNPDLVDRVLIPAFRTASKADCMSGYFSSEILTSIAPGLATYISSSDSPFRLIISPHLKSEDVTAMENGYKTADSVAYEYLEELIEVDPQDAFKRHTLDCFSWLLQKGRLEIKVAVVKDGLFHPKVWLFHQEHDTLVAHGSGNATANAVKRNIEQISIEKSWAHEDGKYRAEVFAKTFDRFWNNQEPAAIVLKAPVAIEERIIQHYRSDSPPREEDLPNIFQKAAAFINKEPPLIGELIGSNQIEFKVPSNLQIDSGPFSHQGQAVDAWVASGYRGILEMATGSGKTITSMVGAYRLFQEKTPLLIVIAAPYVPLIEQWCEEVESFGIRPINLSRGLNLEGRAKEFQRIRRKFDLGLSEVEAIVVSHRTLCSDEFAKELRRFDCTRLLIGDEVHNLGQESFVSNPPEFFEARLGLSATPNRQYDEEGTNLLFKFFAQEIPVSEASGAPSDSDDSVVFTFSLDQAIKSGCLVPYDYFVHPVYLTDQEMLDWYDLTRQIKLNSWQKTDNKPNEFLSALYRKRRLILETAANKLKVLEGLLEERELGKMRHTLIYTTDKAPKQLEEVNELLNRKGVLYHQLTDDETGNRSKTKSIIDSFRDANIQVITAKRVLDEGVNIQEIHEAFILASTTVERQWIQRRGRLLRTCSAINKTHSVIHDFVALPPDLDSDDLDEEERILIKMELTRLMEFAFAARNVGANDGPLRFLRTLTDAIA